jgi:16S rRNA U516 pseudouridylate synthase RsuA-like enzyme
VQIGPVALGDLASGSFRELDDKEVQAFLEAAR